MNKYEKKELKKEKVKSIVKWSAIGLGWSLLLTGFISLLVVGIRGCSKKTTTPPNANVVTAVNKKAPNPHNITIGNVSTAYADTYYYAGFNPMQVRDIDQRYDTHYDVSGSINDTKFYFVTCLTAIVPSDKYFRIRFWTSDTTYLEQYAQYNVSSNTGTLQINDFQLGDLITIDEDINNGYPLTWWLYHATYNIQNYSVDFNDQINYFAPIGASLDFFVQGNFSGAYPIFRGLFTDSEGNAYSEMGLSYITGYATAYGNGGSDYHVNNNQNTSQFMFLYYKRVVDNKLIIVNSADTYTCTANDHQGATCLAKSSHWNSTIFQHIKVVYSIENQWDNELGHYDTLTTSKDLTRRQVLSSFNNLTYGTGISDNPNVGNGLTLIGNAFSSLTGIFGLTILPGITLGVLLFLPLVAGIVLAIVKVVRK